ncbi:phage tail protein [Devosia sp. XGJD_8]|uniref:phage tail protein n=1 Tax=Devosia sp. XGJD_8 TaxID=3391187 RepID=UPI00398478E1
MSLLPQNATPFEVALSEGMEPAAVIGSSITAMRRIKYLSPRASMLPFLVWEYGLGELTPYVPNIYNLIDEGVRWQRLRGTVSAVAIGLAWIGYAAAIEPAWTGRTWWNSFQLRFTALPAADVPDLERIEAITGLSVPKRSQLRRGVFAYDVGAVELDETPLDGAMLDHESGIAITEGGTLWSFGRSHEFEHTLTQIEGQAIGNWLEPVEDAPLLWIDLDDLLWIDADFLWIDDPAEQRRSIMAGWFSDKSLYLRLLDGDGYVIGYRRCRAVHPVGVAFGGAYEHGGQVYDPKQAGGILYAEALTQFDDAADVVCTSIAMVVGGELAAGVKPGKLWLEPDQYIGGTAIAVQATTIPLRRTVREQLKIVMRF